MSEQELQSKLDAVRKEVDHLDHFNGLMSKRILENNPDLKS
jgi:hypothetical protein